jgi:SAM-dependent methyltransferase
MRFRRTPEADVSSTPCPPTQCARRGHSCRDRAIVHSSVLHQLLVAARYALEECDVSETGLFLEHWTNIDPERMARYETMYQWSAAAEAFYTPAEIGEGQAVADFGCGPGHTAIEFACRVGASGHVHALDINAEFIKRTQARAEAAGLADRITTHLLTSERLPLADATLDRITARNTIIYVRNPVATFEEFRRVLKPGGLAHAIESDWSLTAVEPLGSEWRALVGAASGSSLTLRALV